MTRRCACALRALPQPASFAASAASAPAASAAAAAAARPRPDAPPGPPRFTSTFACSPYDPHHQPDHSRDDRDGNNTHQDARHNTPPSQQVPPLSALLPGSFRAPTPMGTSSWTLFLAGYRSRRVLVSCCTPLQFAGQSVAGFMLLVVLDELVQTTAGSGSPNRRRVARTATPSSPARCSRPPSLPRPHQCRGSRRSAAYAPSR